MPRGRIQQLCLWLSPIVCDPQRQSEVCGEDAALSTSFEALISLLFIHSFYLTQAAWPIKHKIHIHTHNTETLG